MMLPMGNVPGPSSEKVGTVTIRRPGVSTVDRNLIGCTTKVRRKASVRKGVKAKNKAKAGNIVRARGGPKVVGEKRVENVTDMSHIGLGFDCPCVKERCRTSPPAVLHREMDGAPSIRHLRTTCPSFSN